MQLENRTEISFEEQQKLAIKSGLCSFEEYCKNPKKWKDMFFGTEDQTLKMLDNGPKRLGNSINKVVYEIFGYKVKTTEEVERIARDYGVSLADLKPFPEFVSCVAGKGDLKIRLMTSEQLQKRNNW